MNTRHVQCRPRTTSHAHSPFELSRSCNARLLSVVGKEAKNKQKDAVFSFPISTTKASSWNFIYLYLFIIILFYLPLLLKVLKMSPFFPPGIFYISSLDSLFSRSRGSCLTCVTMAKAARSWLSARLMTLVMDGSIAPWQLVPMAVLFSHTAKRS